MNSILPLLLDTLSKVWLTFQHNWPFLLASILIAAWLKLYIDVNKVSEFLKRNSRAGVVAATGVAVATPLCSCGTTAVILGMMASSMPWAPVVAFMVASPLTSPQELVYSAGLFGWPFAWTFFLTSIALGLAGGGLAALADRAGWLAGQARFSSNLVPQPQPAALSSHAFQSPEPSRIDLSAMLITPLPTGCGCEASLAVSAPQACSCEAPSSARKVVEWRVFGAEILASGCRLMAMFFLYAFIGYFLNSLIPASWVAAIFGSGKISSVPLAATLGLPLYLNTEASLPLVLGLLDAGMSQGAALAFMVSGAGTSVGAIAGALTIARWRVVGLVIGVLWAGAIAAGYLFDLGHFLGLF